MSINSVPPDLGSVATQAAELAQPEPIVVLGSDSGIPGTAHDPAAIPEDGPRSLGSDGPIDNAITLLWEGGEDWEDGVIPTPSDIETDVEDLILPVSPGQSQGDVVAGIDLDGIELPPSPSVLPQEGPPSIESAPEEVPTTTDEPIVLNRSDIGELLRNHSLEQRGPIHSIAEPTVQYALPSGETIGLTFRENKTVEIAPDASEAAIAELLALIEALP